ncbi:alcohol dehydrogenase [Stutzerimonas balearica]|jgi:alcohol dehydrogenase class IV|uniref:iron-containing alcohol dehydrogenase n=1 Tax=Stutzerimonas stutzeri group TaxID=136846 RepID=UPI000651E2C7|nr:MULTISPECIES: iron-containing alcohol dehydrogenase [Stutzerimonas stutzeri group]WIX03316.1 iron-containing alcohol dehydrogenase [Pseudomonas sp. AR5]HBB23919.1 alcohol dehydrogenase [Pseudomonas sp.]AKN25483.1 iron-containing alcohol dehydrogenase [Stutzerimonas stutzeri]MBK3759090.1 iron-containing alcohol dehydrogenase [Stutzerimonas frequens]MBO0640286.1 iron-containing alcohol dehydrogenase [Stutzerimonas stutzeri]
MSHRIVLPRLMEVGAGASGQLARVLQELGCSRPLIVTDRMMVELGYVARIAGQLEEAGIASQCFADTLPEPTAASIRAGVEMVRQGDFDSIVALGGGSPIDSAKAIGILGKFGGEMRDYRFPRDVSEAGLPLIAIPTTAGTGSEATRFTIITDETSDEKMLCAGLGFMPIAALIDYELTLSLPPRVTADTGIDALTHAIEAYVSRKASLYSDSQALEAMRLLAPNLRTAFHQPDDRAAREAMMLGATLAGIAFSNASVALVHGMSRPIGAFFHVPHGLSNAMLLPAITAFSIPAAPERYADCARAMGVAAQTDSVEVANDKLLAELRAINQELKVPSPEQFGIARERFFELRATMARQALASGSPGNNPRVPTEAEIIDLYETVWNQE